MRTDSDSLSNEDGIREPKIGRRALLLAGAKLTAVVTFCATLGTTLISACNSSDGLDDGDGYGYGYSDDFPSDNDDDDDNGDDDINEDEQA